MAKPEELVKGAEVEVTLKGVLPATLFPGDNIVTVDVAASFPGSGVAMISVPIEAVEVQKQEGSPDAVADQEVAG